MLVTISLSKIKSSLSLSYGPIFFQIAEDMLTVESSITGAAVGATMLSAVVKLREGYVVKSNAIYIVVSSLAYYQVKFVDW